MIEILTSVVNALNTYIWAGLVYILFGAGLYFTFASRFVQIRLFGQSIKRMIVGKRGSDDAISPFQAFATGLASRVGTGNVAGVAIAIAVGGPGAIFWMWLTALIGMSSAFVESSVAQLYKVQDPDGSFRGGPAYYITKGLGQKWLGVAFSLSLILAFGFVFNAVQANTITGSVIQAWFSDGTISKDLATNLTRLIGVFLVILTAVVIFGGIKRVASFAERIVPTMALLYLGVAIYIILANITKVPEVFSLIITDAFNFNSAAGGLFGALSVAMINGIKRGLFSNEAGMGSAPNAAAASDAYHPANQGLIQMLGVFVDTIVVCSCTAFIILVSGVYEGAKEKGAALTQLALENGIGQYGSGFLAVLLFMFCFSSIVGNYAYAESNVQFIKNNPIVLNIFRFMVLGMVYFGAVQKVGLVWDMADASMGIMALINLVSIIILAPTAMLLLRDFEEQIKAGKKPVFDINKYPELKKKVGTKIWEK